jgi:hypothetical protein
MYVNRLRRALGRDANYLLTPRAGLGHRLALLAYKRVASICLFLEKDNTYENRGFHTPEEYLAQKAMGDAAQE